MGMIRPVKTKALPKAIMQQTHFGNKCLKNETE